MSRRVLTPPPARSELACFLTIVVLAFPLGIIALGWCLWWLVQIGVQVCRWLRAESSITARELWADRWEMAAYLFALTMLAFLIFFYPFQP